MVDEEMEEAKDTFSCPMVTIQLENVTTRALIDSGSQISCISESFDERNAGVLSKALALPVVGISVIGATGGRPVKPKKQIYAEFSLGKLKSHGVFVVVPRLSKACIIGVNILKSLGGIIDFKHDNLTVSNQEMERVISTAEEEANKEPAETRQISEVNNVSVEDEMFEEELGNKISNNDRISV